MSEIKHNIHVKASCNTIYEALTTKQGLESWFTSKVKGSGQVGTDWQLDFSNEPSFHWRIVKSENPHRVAWECLKGPGNSPGTHVEFVMKATANDHATLTIIHQGWSKDDPKFERCVDIWRKLMHHLQRYCEQDIAESAYSSTTNYDPRHAK